MNKNVMPKLRKIISDGVKEAKPFDDAHLRPEHVILATISDNNNEAVRILKKMKIDTQELYDKLSEYIRNSDLKPRGYNIIENKLPLSDDLKLIFKNIDKEAENVNDENVDITHLMLAILNNRNELTRQLANIGITYKNFKEIMMNIKNEDQINNFGETDNFEEITNDPDDRFKRTKAKSQQTSKTPVLDNFCRDISKAVERGEIDPVVGRAKEIKRITQILSRRKKNNPILAGEAGVGKTAIIEGLAQRIKDGDCPRTIANKKIYSLEMATVVSGTKYRGQFEERMKAILEECKANPNIILFIDELHTIVGAGNSSGALDASNIFKPALARGEIQIIGATTLDEYREHIEKDAALTRRFQQVIVEQTTLEETKTILHNIKSKYEKHHSVKYTDDAIDECVKLADRYIMERSMPDKAIDLMDEAGAAANVKLEKPQQIKDLEEKKQQIFLRKKEVVAKQDFEQAAKLRDDEKKIDDELSVAITSWNTKNEKKAISVGVEEITEVVSMITGIPLNKISSQESKRLINLDKELIGKVIGQDEAVVKVVKAIKRSRVGIKDKKKPQGSFIFLGPTGVGKTYLAKLLAETIYGDEDAMIRIDMSEYMEKHTVSKLIGAPPGYVGYEQGGQLTEKVRRKPYCVILFDEIEKANEDVFNILLQVLDDGQLTDGLGRKVNFKNTLIIMTSNVGVKQLNQFGTRVGFETNATINSDEERRKGIIQKALKDKFKPEFLNRIDEAIIFNTLKEDDINKIVSIELQKLEGRLSELHLKLKVTKSAIDFLGKEGYDESYGARPLSRTIQRYVEDPISDEILSGNVKDGDTIKVNYDKTNDIITVKGE